MGRLSNPMGLATAVATAALALGLGCGDSSEAGVASGGASAAGASATGGGSGADGGTGAVAGAGTGGGGSAGTGGLGGVAGLGPETGLFVDPQIGSESCTDYDPTSRSCGAGSTLAYSTLAGAAAVAAAGNVVLVREGTYREQLAPAASGTADAPITYRNYQAEVVSLSGDFSPAIILLDQISWCVIQGFIVDQTRWLEATDSHHNLIQHNRFTSTPASGTTGNVRFISSHHNRIAGNTISNGNDNLLLIDSDYNVVEGNTITEGRHSVWGIRCGDFNVIRNNYFANTQQKIGEVYDCGADTSAVPNSLNSTTHNLIEGNTFADSSSYYSTSGGNGIQYAGQDGIVRRNIFYENNSGLGMQVYGDEAEHNERNRVYHNVFHANDCAGISTSGSGVDNVFVNNVLCQNRGVSGDCFGDGTAQLVYRNPLTGFRFENNDLFHTQPGENVIQDEFDVGNTVAYFEASYPEMFRANLEVDPGFVGAAGHDYTLLATSQLIDAGAFLTRAVGSGSGTTLVVADSRYFYDGFGIAGETGDLVQLSDQTETAQVLSIDHDTNTLTLDRALSWSDGQGVSLAFNGAAPDIGAFEAEP